MRLGIELLDGDGPVREHALARPLRVGRALDNDLVLAHPDVSAHHAVVSQLGQEAVLTDLRSTNGTTVNGEPVTRGRRLLDGDLVGFGDAAFVVVRLDEAPPRPTAGAPLFLEDPASGLVHAVDPSGVVVVGGATLTFRDEGDRLVCVGPGGPIPIGADGALALGPRLLRVRRPAPAATTRRARGPAFRYEVEARLTDVPRARFVDRLGGRQHTVVAETRALLVFLLARQWLADRDAGRPEGGWCDDDRLRTGIWGGPGRAHLGNNLNVVISRTRRELEEHGLDGRCIERRKGRTRLVVEAAVVEGGPRP